MIRKTVRQLLRTVPRVIATAFLILMGMLFTSCSKETLLGPHTGVLQPTGEWDFPFTGEDARREERYTGRYSAEFKGYNGIQYLFAGSCLGREDGETVTIRCQMEIESGKAKVFLCSESGETTVLLLGSGSCAETLALPEGVNYFGVTGEDFSGKLELEVE